MRLPERLLDAVRGAAKRQGVPYQRLIRMAIESALDRGARTWFADLQRPIPSYALRFC